MHLFIFANFTAKIIKTFGLKLYYVLNFLLNHIFYGNQIVVLNL